ncbi:hypothetical protein WA026_017481 [Henosepilachna vigintioctopunctata]|uniref:Uncharacterized protein n=1 Tax=Henosepilachna vigintioctopunctata TaxID=420089 RepID=A0AAW1VBE0_9CUCU
MGQKCIPETLLTHEKPGKEPSRDGDYTQKQINPRHRLPANRQAGILSKKTRHAFSAVALAFGRSSVIPGWSRWLRRNG